jgi:eukaryotic-like serine/threonine-protein kinase
MKIGDYAVEETIGQGGMGTVVRARSPSGEVVAIKLLLNPRNDRVVRFQREQYLLKKLNKHGFVPILDWGDSQLGPFFVMPLLSGGSLADRLKTGPLSVSETVSVGLAVAKAMSKAHAKKIIHRDLKPDNVLFGSDGTPQVADLGLAKHFGPEATRDEPRISSTGEVRGTWGYMAPEQIRDSKSVGPTADVFSMGAILYECLSGEPAFPGGNAFEVLANITSPDLPALERSEFPLWLRTAIRSALSFDARERPKNAAAFAHLLARGPRKTRWKNRRIAAWIGAGLGLFIGIRYGDELPKLWDRATEPKKALRVIPDGEAPVSSQSQ